MRLILVALLLISLGSGYSKPLARDSVYVYSPTQLFSFKDRAEFRIDFSINKHAGSKRIDELVLLSCARTALSHGYKYFCLKSKKKSWNYRDTSIRVVIECFRHKVIRKGLDTYDAKKVASEYAHS